MSSAKFCLGLNVLRVSVCALSSKVRQVYVSSIYTETEVKTLHIKTVATDVVTMNDSDWGNGL